MLSPDQWQQERGINTRSIHFASQAERQKTLVNARLAKRLVSEMTGTGRDDRFQSYGLAE